MTDATKLRPSKEFIIEAIPAQTSRGFYGLFAYPGRIPEYVKEDDRAKLFLTSQEAVSEAAAILVYFLNDRLVPSPQLRFTHMGGGDFAVALRELDLTVTEFAPMYGTTPERVHQWIDGTKEVPFPMWLVLETLRAPGGIEVARRIVRKHADLRRPHTRPRSLVEMDVANE